MNRKRRNKTGFFLGILLLLFGKCVRAAADRAGERAESAVCNGGMPDGWRYRPCAVRKTRDRSYGNGEHNENHDMHSGTGKRTESRRSQLHRLKQPQRRKYISVCREGEQFLLGDLSVFPDAGIAQRRGGDDRGDHRRKRRGICRAYERKSRCNRLYRYAFCDAERSRCFRRRRRSPHDSS